MTMDSTVQVRMDSKLKTEVEELYRNLGTSFAEAVRIFAQQSIREGGMPFRPRLITLDDMDDKQFGAKLANSIREAELGEIMSQDEVDVLMEAKFSNAGSKTV